MWLHLLLAIASTPKNSLKEYANTVDPGCSVNHPKRMQRPGKAGEFACFKPPNIEWSPSSLCECDCQGCTQTNRESACELDVARRPCEAIVDPGIPHDIKIDLSINQPASATPLQECEGHCYADSECESGLICYKGVVRGEATGVSDESTTSLSVVDPFVPGCDAKTRLYYTTMSVDQVPSYCVQSINVMNGTQGSESRIVRYQGTSCYFSTQGEITSLEQHMLCRGGFCAVDVEVIVKKKPTLRKVVHNEILSNRLIKGAEGSTPQIVQDKAMCSITLESAPINLNSRAIFHNSALQYLDSDENEGIGVVRASSRANTELGRAGAVGPGKWTAAYAKQLDLFDMEATGTSEFKETPAQGYFPITITTEKPAGNSRIIIQGTEGLDTKQHTISFDRFVVRSDVCTLTLYNRRNFGDESGGDQGHIVIKPGDLKCPWGHMCRLDSSHRINGNDLIDPEFKVKRISSYTLSGENCRAMFLRDDEDNSWTWDDTKGMTSTYPYRVVYTGQQGTVMCKQIGAKRDDNDCSKDSMGRSFSGWEDAITHVWLIHLDEDRCTPYGGHWRFFTREGERMTCRGQMRFGSHHGAGSRVYDTMQMDGDVCSANALSEKARHIGTHKTFESNPLLPDVGCECCSINLDTYTNYGSLIPKGCTDKVTTCTHNIQLVGGGALTIAYFGGSGVGTLGYESWKGSISGPDGQVIANTSAKEMTYIHRSNYDRRRRRATSLAHNKPQSDYVSEITSFAPTKKSLVLSDVLIKWKCSAGKFFVCEHALSPPPMGGSCCQQCPLGEYRTNNRCVACERGKFNPIGHSTVAQDHTMHYGNRVANLQVSLGASTDKRISVPSCQPGSCNCHSFKKNTKCADGTRVPAKSVTSALRTSDTDESRLHLDVRIRDCSAICDTTPMCSVYESRVVVVDGRKTAQCFTFDETCVEVPEDPYWPNPEFATVVNRKVLLKAISFGIEDLDMCVAWSNAPYEHHIGSIQCVIGRYYKNCNGLWKCTGGQSGTDIEFVTGNDIWKWCEQMGFKKVDLWECDYMLIDVCYEWNLATWFEHLEHCNTGKFYKNCNGLWLCQGSGPQLRYVAATSSGFDDSIIDRCSGAYSVRRNLEHDCNYEFVLDDAGASELLAIKLRGKQVTLKTAHGKYVVAESDGRANANRDAPGPWERWTVEHKGGNAVCFVGYSGKYLVAEVDGAANANRDGCGPYETFQLSSRGAQITLQSSHGKYLVAESDGTLNANRDGPPRAWETFTVEWTRETQLLPIRQYYEIGKTCDSSVLYERNLNDLGTYIDIIGCEQLCRDRGEIAHDFLGRTAPCYAASYNNVTNICKLFGLECFRKPLVPTNMHTTTFTARKSYVESDNNVEYPQFKFTRIDDSTERNVERFEYSFQCTLAESVRHTCLDCPAGQYADEPGMPACKYCTSDTFQPLKGQTACNACDPGSFSYREADRFGNPIQQLTYCERPVAPCNPVTSKLIDNVCVDKRICPEGHVFSAASSQCVACEQGFFAGADNVCASISDVCHCEPDVCQDTAEKRGFVFAGKYNKDTLRCDPDCEALGAFFDYGLQSCQCEGGLALSASHTRCSACPRGTHTVESRCVACAVGKYQPKSGEPECLLCQNGQYADVSGSVRCKFCDTTQQSTAQREGCMLCGPDQTTLRANRQHRDELSDVPCLKECPQGTYAVHDSASNSPLCADLCNKGETLDSFGRCAACETGRYKSTRPAVQRDISHNTSYTCQYCPAGKFQTLEGRDACTDGIPFSDVTGVDEPTTVGGLRKVVHYCAATVEEAQCKLCGIDRTDQALTISSGVWVADEGQPLWSQQNYFRIGNLNDGYSKWKYLGNSSLGTKPLCTYETFAGYDVPPITSPPHCQMLPNTDYLDDTQTCGDIGQNMAASVNTFSRQQCRRCSWPFKPDSACGCVADEEPYYFPGFQHDTDTRVISGFGPFLHGGAANECPDYSNLPSAAFGLVDGVSLVDLQAVNMPLTQCPDRAQATTCNMGAILCEPECTCNCHPGFAGEQCDTCEDTNADFDLLCKSCKPGWVTGLFNRCSRCESGLDVRTACTECIPFLDDTMCYGVNEACVPRVQRPEMSFMRTRHTWISDSHAFASMPHASAGRVPDYLDNKCIAHDGLVYSFHQESSTVLVQPGNGTADVPRQAVATWPWTLNVQHSLNFTVCDDVETTTYLLQQKYTTTHAPDELLWQCVQDDQNRQWVVAGVDKMQTTGCSAPWTHANDVLRVMPTGMAFTPLTARLHDFVSAGLRWTSISASSYYKCSTADRAWLYMLETGVCMHQHANGTQLPITAVAVTGNRDTGAVGYPWRSPVSIMHNDTDLLSTHANTVSRLHCVQLCDGAEYWVYKRASCRCFGAGFMQHDEETPLGYVMLYDANPQNVTFTKATGNKPYRCPRNATHAPWRSLCTKGADVFAEWGGVRESTPLLRQYHVTEIVTGYEDTTIDITAGPESTCSTRPFQTTQVESTRIVHPMRHQTAGKVPVTESRDTQMLFRQTEARTQGLYEIHIEPDFDECNEVAKASSVLANLQAQQTAGSTFCTERTCNHVMVDMTQSIARAQNAYQLALAKCKLSIDLMGDTHFYVSLTQCAPYEVPSAAGCLNASDVATPMTTAPTPAPTKLSQTSSLVNPVTAQTLYFGNCTCNGGGLCNCTCNCDGHHSSIAETQLPFNHTSGAVDCNEFCRIAPLPDVSTDFCTYSRERRLFHMHYMPEWTLTRSTNTTDDADAMRWCQSNIACSLFTRDGTSYKYYADPEYTLVNCNQPRRSSLFRQAADYSLTATTYYKSSCCTGVII